MSYINPVSFFDTNSPSFKKKQKNTNENKQKKLNWKQGLLIGAVATAVVVEFMTTRTPSVRFRKKYYEEVFSKTSDNLQRKLPMLSKREEVILTEAAMGNKAAEKLMSTLGDDAEGIKRYLKTKNKFENAQKYLEEGRFDDFKRRGDNTTEDTKKWFMRQMKGLEKKTEALYKEYIEPRIQK